MFGVKVLLETSTHLIELRAQKHLILQIFKFQKQDLLLFFQEVAHVTHGVKMMLVNLDMEILFHDKPQHELKILKAKESLQ